MTEENKRKKMYRKTLLLLTLILIVLLSGCNSSSNNSDEKPTSNFVKPPMPTVIENLPVERPEINTSSEEQFFYVKWHASLISNNSVGNSWGTFAYIGGDEVGSNAISVSTGKLCVDLQAIEYDSYNDIGRASIEFDCSNIDVQATQTVQVKVRENRGRYSGNIAVWEFTVTVTRAS